MLHTNKFSSRVRIERQSVADDGYGNVQAPWAVPQIVCERWAGWLPRFGRERVEAGRLDAGESGTVTVLRDPETATITPADRVVFTVGVNLGRIGNIRSIVATDPEIQIVVDLGVAT